MPNLDDKFNTPGPATKIALTRDDILGALKWSDPREVTTKVGQRITREAKPSPEFFELYDREGPALRELGYTLGRWPKDTGPWKVTKWEKVPEKVVIERQQANELSRATDADIRIPSPEGMSFFGYQKAGVAFAVSRPSTLIADEPGLGKTCQAIGVVNCLPDAKRILVICPASLKENWRREILRWQVVNRPVFIADAKMLPDMHGWVVVNYDVLTRHEDILHRLEFDVLIADEIHYCFPAGTMVETVSGLMPIERIVNLNLSSSVYCVNPQTRKTEVRTVSGWYSHLNSRSIVKITHEHGILRCTEDHPICVRSKGWVRAGEILAGDELYRVSGEICDTSASGRQEEVLHEAMQCAEQEQKSRLHEGAFGNDVGGSSQVGREEEKAGFGAANEDGQSDERSGNQGAREKKQNREDLLIQGWKRPANYATAHPSFSTLLRVADGIRDSDRSGQGAVSVAPNELQSRSGVSRDEVGRRGRRANAHDEEMAFLGSPEGIGLSGSRVESVEILESAGGYRSRVYCIDVDEHHNFFADGILVHNCKNKDSQRSKMVFGIKPTKKQRDAGVPEVPGIRAKKKLLLTGTPICNRPMELFPLINYLDPVAWPDFFKYALRYCDADRDGGYWNFKGASNLFELQQKLRSTLMVRRLKKDVLKDLPRKLRRVVEFSPSGEMLDVVKEERAKFGSDEDYKKEVERMMLKADFNGDRATYRKNCAIAKVKMKEVLAYLDDAIEESGKIIVFIWHHEVARILKEHFGHKMLLIMGDTPLPARQAAVDAFQNDANMPVIVGGIKPMGVGLTLTAASRVIFLELDDVPGNVTQAEDRAHRIGQQDNVLVEHLIVTGTLDAVQARNCVEKQEIIDKALDLEKNPGARPKPVGESVTTVAAAVAQPADIPGQQLKLL